MNETAAKQLIQRYGRSYYFDRTAEGWFEANSDARRRGQADGTIDARAVGGTTVPIAKGRELASIMLDNVREARDDLQATAARLKRARLDGLLNKSEFEGLDKKLQEAWVKAAIVVRGDYQQAVAELAHWQRYAEEASAGTLPTLKTSAGGGTELLKALAEMKAYPPDPRLPPERDEEVA
jgi:hypothetical protein